MEARTALSALPNDLDWGTPVLFTRAGDGRVFDIQRDLTEQPPSIAPEAELVSPNPLQQAQLSTASSVDFILVTALPEELAAVLAKLPGHQQLPPTNEDIRIYYQADLPVTFPDNSTGTYRVVVLCLLGMGRVQAVVATADAIRRWQPRYVILTGIAGGMATRKVKIGDILISDQIVDYELQKITPKGPEVRWDVQRADPRLLGACNSLRDENWQGLIQVNRPDSGYPAGFVGPIASGDKVIAFGKVLTRYRAMWPKLIGVEMEAAGAATAAFQSPIKPGFFMVRGVSDLADEDKGSSGVENWRLYACDVAAAFTIALLKSGPVPLSEKYFKETTMADKAYAARTERHEDEKPDRQPLVGPMSGGIVIEGGVHAKRDVIMGDQINLQDQRVLQINNPEEFRKTLAQVQADLAALRQLPGLSAEQAQMVEVVEGQVQQAVQEAQQPQPLGARITAVLAGAQATLKLLTGNVKAAVGLALTLDKLVQAAQTVYQAASKFIAQ